MFLQNLPKKKSTDAANGFLGKSMSPYSIMRSMLLFAVV
jgi:hypothetical protein